MTFDPIFIQDEELDWWFTIGLKPMKKPIEQVPSYEVPLLTSEESDEKEEESHSPPPPHYFSPHPPFLHPLKFISSFIPDVAETKAGELEGLAKLIAELPDKKVRESSLEQTVNAFLNSIPDTVTYEISDQLLAMILGDKIATHAALVNEASDNQQFLLTVLRHTGADKKLIEEFDALCQLQKLF